MKEAHVGLILIIFSPDLDLTKSLFMKRPTGCLNSRPLGALRLIKRSEVMLCQNLKEMSEVMVVEMKKKSDCVKRKKNAEHTPPRGCRLG